MRSLPVSPPASSVPLVLAAFAAGVGVLQTREALPALPALGMALATVLGIGSALLGRRGAPAGGLRWGRLAGLVLAAGLAGFGYAAWRGAVRLADALPADWEGRDIALVGVVDGLPERTERGVRFVLAVERAETPGAQVPSRLALAWQAGDDERRRASLQRKGRRDDTGESRPPPARGTAAADRRGPAESVADESEGIPAVAAGERWRVVARLRRPHGSVNPGGFDLEAWLLERNLRATGYVRASGANERLDAFAARPGDFVQRARERVRERILASLPGAPYAGVVAALAIGDQRAIPDAQWTVFNRTGVGHLVSMSGLHVTALAALAALGAARLARWSTRVTDVLPARSVGALAGVAAAGAYTLLAGAEVPALRTFTMLATGALALVALRPPSFAVAWLWALAVVLAVDPWAVLAPGFWLSYGAVAVLIYANAGRVAPAPHAGWRTRVAAKLRDGARTQWAVTAGLVPFALSLFGQVSLVSPLANAFAIPIVTFAVVPFAVGGIGVPGGACFALAHAMLTPLMGVLERLAEAPGAAWTQHAPVGWTLAAAAAGVAWLLAPPGVPGRALGVLWLAPLALVSPPPPPEGVARVTVLDVGQGLAVVVRTRAHALVYDTGPRWNETSDAGSRIVAPYLRREGIVKLDALVLSHEDLDHAGGAAALLVAVPVVRFLSSLPADHPLVDSRARESAKVERCFAGMRWEWDGVAFEVLHPWPEQYAAAPAKANDLSCVLRVRAGATSVLLPGDLESRGEARLLRDRPGGLRADAIVVPHHGSRTSSTRAFVVAVAPSLAVVSSGYRNRFGHPRAEVVGRYTAAGAVVARSDLEGAILFDVSPEGVSKAVRSRAAELRYWHDRPPQPEGSSRREARGAREPAAPT